MGKKGYYLIIVLVVLVALAIILPYEVTILRRGQVEETAPIVTEEDVDFDTVELDEIIDIDELEQDLAPETADLEAQMEDLEQRLIAAEERELKTEMKISHTERKEVEPDLASMILGVENRGDDVEETYTENSKTMQEAREALAEEFDLEFETLTYRLRQDQEEQYIVTNRIKTEITDLDLLGEIIDLAVQKGINKLEDIDYQISEREQYQIETTSEAIARIEDKAGRISAEFGSPEYRFKEIEIEDDFSGNTVRPVHFSARVEAMDREPVEITPGNIEFTTRIRAIVEF